MIKSLIFSFIRLGCVIALLTGILWYLHSNVLGYQRFICKDDELTEGHICLDTVLKEGRDKVIWVDARSEDAFERSAVQDQEGNWTLFRMPVVAVRNDMNAQTLLAQAMPHLLAAYPEGRRIVVFCDRSCSSADEVAMTLRSPDLGLDAPIYVLEGGWDILRKGILKDKESGKEKS